MTRKLLLTLLVLTAPALGGCALQAAMAAVQLAQHIEAPMGPGNAHLRPVATQACTDRAKPYGSVYIVDIEQRRADRIIVWGSVTDQQQRRRTFECHFTTSLTRFSLGEYLPAS